ncbi:MAG: nuclear transport factor 2 family protein [Phycisphaerales bacterium JB043]
MARLTTIGVAFLVLTGCSVQHGTRFDVAHAESDGEARASIDLMLDDFHDAASDADFDRYFSHFAPEGYFLGTDASERWSRAMFERYTRARFETGTGWTYAPRTREVVIDLERGYAWFDELLDNERYGTSRGTGTLSRDTHGAWKIEQYHLSFPIPNDIAASLTDQIKSFEASRRNGQ